MTQEITGNHREQFHKVSLKKEKLSSFFYDISKIVLSATSIAAITAIVNREYTITHLYVGIMGLFLTIFFGWLANKTLTY